MKGKIFFFIFVRGFKGKKERIFYPPFHCSFIKRTQLKSDFLIYKNKMFVMINVFSFNQIFII